MKFRAGRGSLSTRNEKSFLICAIPSSVWNICCHLLHLLHYNSAVQKNDCLKGFKGNSMLDLKYVCLY